MVARMAHPPSPPVMVPRQPSENELDIARFQGKHVATIAGRLVRV